MEPSLSFDASIVLRTAQDEVRYRRARGDRPGSGAMRSDHVDAPAPEVPPLAALRGVSGRWLFDARRRAVSASTASRWAARRIISAGDVLTIAGSQLLVEEATPTTLALRRFDLVGNDTLPPVGDSVRVLAPSIEDLPIDIGEVPSIEGFVPQAARAVERSKWNYAAWAMGVLLALVLGVFALLEPIALDLRPADAAVKSVGGFSWQSASSVFVFPGDHRLLASREGYQPAEVQRQGRRSRAGACARSTSSNYPASSKWTPAASPPRSPPTARRSAAYPAR